MTNWLWIMWLAGHCVLNGRCVTPTYDDISKRSKTLHECALASECQLFLPNTSPSLGTFWQTFMATIIYRVSSSWHKFSKESMNKRSAEKAGMETSKIYFIFLMYTQIQVSNHVEYLENKYKFLTYKCIYFFILI